MEIPKVKVLLSSYNGAKYIQEQLDSLFAQTYPNIELYLRDDGSADDTLAVVQHCAGGRDIHITEGKNLGFARSFFTLLQDCGRADYFAFCDQDDVWSEDKIERAVAVLREEDASIPLLYCTRYDFYDKDLRHIGLGPCKSPSFPNCIVDLVSIGATFVINAKTREMVLQNMPQEVVGHDCWIYMLCQGMGKVIFDPRPSLKYRRTGENASTTAGSFWKRNLGRIRQFLFQKGFEKIRAQARGYWDLYASRLSEEDRKTLALFIRRTPATALKKLFYPGRFRATLAEELMLRCTFLLGRL